MQGLVAAEENEIGRPIECTTSSINQLAILVSVQQWTKRSLSITTTIPRKSVRQPKWLSARISTVSTPLRSELRKLPELAIWPEWTSSLWTLQSVGILQLLLVYSSLVFMSYHVFNVHSLSFTYTRLNSSLKSIQRKSPQLRSFVFIPKKTPFNPAICARFSISNLNPVGWQHKG